MNPDEDLAVEQPDEMPEEPREIHEPENEDIVDEPVPDEEAGA